MRALTTVAEVDKCKLDRSTTEWMLLELQEHKRVMVDDVDGRVVWLNVHGYKPGGGSDG